MKLLVFKCPFVRLRRYIFPSRWKFMVGSFLRHFNYLKNRAVWLCRSFLTTSFKDLASVVASWLSVKHVMLLQGSWTRCRVSLWRSAILHAGRTKMTESKGCAATGEREMWWSGRNARGKKRATKEKKKGPRTRRQR